MRRVVILLLPFLFLLGGCSYYLSQESRTLADPSVRFPMLMQDADAYRGKIVLLGGTVVALYQDRHGSTLLIEQHKLDKRNLPDESIPTMGRFLATTSERLDPGKFGSGTLVSLAGTVVGSQVATFQGAQYRLPVVAIREIHDIVIEQETHWGSWGGV